MSYQLARRESWDRVREKQESRERDAAAIASGRIAKGDLRNANGFFSALPLSRFKVVAIGGKAVIRA